MLLYISNILQSTSAYGIDVTFRTFATLLLSSIQVHIYIHETFTLTVSNITHHAHVNSYNLLCHFLSTKRLLDPDAAGVITVMVRVYWTWSFQANMLLMFAQHGLRNTWVWILEVKQCMRCALLWTVEVKEKGKAHCCRQIVWAGMALAGYIKSKSMPTRPQGPAYRLNSRRCPTGVSLGSRWL